MNKVYIVSYDDGAPGHWPVCFYTDERKAQEHAAQIRGKVLALERGKLPRKKGEAWMMVLSAR